MESSRKPKSTRRLKILFPSLAIRNLLCAKITPSVVFFLVCLSFLGGILFGLFNEVIVFLAYAVAWLSVVLVAFTLYRYPLITATSFVILFFAVGIVWVEVVQLRALNNPFVSHIGTKVVLVGQVAEPPVPQQKSVRFRFSVESLNGLNNFQNKKLSVVARSYPEVSLGDRLRLTCKLASEEFSRNRGEATCLFPEVVIESRETSFSFRGFLENIRQYFIGSIKNVFPEPTAGFISGLLVGGTSGLSSVWRDAFIVTGTIHLVALSGFNITIISGFLILILQTLALPRRFYVPIIGIILTIFVIMVGAHASIVRAAIMGMLVVVARHLGRRSSPRNALALTAVIMVAVNPETLILDIGFQLSFLATVGIIYLYPILERYFVRLPEFFKLKEALLMTMAAQIFVIPLLLYHFERLSLISPLVNMLVVPPIPFIMFFGFLAGMAGLGATTIGQIIGLVGWLGASAVLKIIQYGALLPYASIGFSISFGAILIYYLILGAVTIWFSRSPGQAPFRPI